MIDLVKVQLKAGDGGDGRVSFRREKYVPKGGPDGGQGGDGGNIIIRGTKQYATLKHFAGKKRFDAEDGQGGGKRKKTGAKGSDVVLEVPVGTSVWLLAENAASRYRRRHPHNYLTPRKYFLMKEGEHVPALPEGELHPVEAATSSEVPAAVNTEIIYEQNQIHHQDFRQLPKLELAQITEEGQEIVVARGGRGGRGNVSFASSRNTTPLEAEYGTEGDRKVVVLELKLLADLGFVGYPNAGKSTLLSRLTNARPKIADYPFTTLEPQLGTMTLPGDKQSREVVFADIPGLIAGASQGKGLGHTFLRHIENCQALVYVLAPDDTFLLSEPTPQALVDFIVGQYESLHQELEEYAPELVERPMVQIVNKRDIYTPEQVAALEAAPELEDAILISAATGENIDRLKQRVAQLLDERDAQEADAQA